VVLAAVVVLVVLLLLLWFIVSVVVDSVLDRMELSDVSVPGDDGATEMLRTLREQTGLIDDEFSVHEDVAITGEAFVLVWPNEAGGIDAYHNDARLCYAEYDSDNPRRWRGWRWGRDWQRLWRRRHGR
jgi:hypothetical protein